MVSDIGVELEAQLLDRDGIIANMALGVLQDPRVRDFTRYELSMSVVEVVTAPHQTIHQLHADLVGRLRRVDQVATELGVLVAPVSELGAGQGERSLLYEIDRMQREILGKRANDLQIKACGVHAHLSQDAERKVDQYNLLTAEDPLTYGITSTSPFLEGRNGFNSHRVRSLREEVFAEFPVLAQLQPYIQREEELVQQAQQRYEILKAAAVARGISLDQFERTHTIWKAGYAPIKTRHDIGGGTFEVRGGDACPPKTATSLAALLKGSNDHMLEGKIPVEIATVDGDYRFSNRGIVLPTFAYLQGTLVPQAVKYGLHGSDVAPYFKAVRKFAREGLPEQDRKYLPRGLDNTADRMMHKHESLMRWNPQEAARQGQLFVHDLYRADLARG